MEPHGWKSDQHTQLYKHAQVTFSYTFYRAPQSRRVRSLHCSNERLKAAHGAEEVSTMKDRVLVVDDDRLVADPRCLIFRANGFESEARYSAAAGFAYAQSYAPSLMLCDVIMPEESGLQLARRVREAMPGTQLLLLTAYPSTVPDVQDAAGTSRMPLKLLNKPCRPDDLLRETRALLQIG